MTRGENTGLTEQETVQPGLADENRSIHHWRPA